MISEESCDTEELSNDAENSAVQYQVKNVILKCMFDYIEFLNSVYDVV